MVWRQGGEDPAAEGDDAHKEGEDNHDDMAVRNQIEVFIGVADVMDRVSGQGYRQGPTSSSSCAIDSSSTDKSIQASAARTCL